MSLSEPPPAIVPSPPPPSNGEAVHAAPAPDALAFDSVPPPEFEFAGWGSVEKIDDLVPEGVEVHDLDETPRHALGVWASTAICGNDITSSCLYVSALAAVQAGALAPLALGIVALVLYFFRTIYAEVGSALPLNGGTYTLLLNTTNKKLAAGAAVLTLLSYVATACISAGEAMHYAQNLWGALDVNWATVGLLAFFAFLNLIGITESAVVALLIFAAHLLTLVVLSGASAVMFARHPEQFLHNWHVPTPGGFAHGLFFGFAAAMLGISGFESSANFIEEQKSGVFPKTLRNMWVAVAVFNPLISLLSLGVLPLAFIGDHQTDLLAQMGEAAAGRWLGVWVSVDAVLVLSGAVLTSFVGVTGLVRRMALDRCLPQLLLRENKVRKTNHYIIVGFFLVCCSILLATLGPTELPGGGQGPLEFDVEILAGVYTISFLSVMALFAIGNMLLKAKRGRLPRDVRASWTAVVFALLMVVLGLAGNVFMDPAYVRVFGIYFGIFALAVAVMFLRVQLLKVMLFVTQAVISRVRALHDRVHGLVREKIDEINDRVVVYFTRADDPALLNRAALYVLENEQTNRLKVVHVYQDESEIPSTLAERIHIIDRLYPDLRIDFLAVKGKFGPELIEVLSKRLNVPKNYMFIGTPSDRFPHRIETLGGVRVIL